MKSLAIRSSTKMRNQNKPSFLIKPSIFHPNGITITKFRSIMSLSRQGLLEKT